MQRNRPKSRQNILWRAGYKFKSKRGSPLSMKLIYTHENLALVTNAQALLEAAGIDSEVRNQFAVGGRGELPVFETWPELWVLHDRHIASAQRIIESLQHPQPDRPWDCEGCGENNADSFEFCWRCGAERTST